MRNHSSNPKDYADNYDDVSMFSLSGEREQTLLERQTECTFMWTTREGDPVGVIMNFVYYDGSFWLTCTRRRKRVRAIETRPRVAIAITSRGTNIGVSQAVTYKGRATVLEDVNTRAWFYPVLAAKVRPGDQPAQAAFVDHLDTSGRVVIRVDPDGRIGFDSEQMFANSPAGKTNTGVDQWSRPVAEHGDDDTANQPRGPR